MVDDVPENVRLLEAVLDAHGYDVVSATDGQAALDLALSAKPDLVLLDVMMPHPDGSPFAGGFASKRRRRSCR